MGQPLVAVAFSGVQSDDLNISYSQGDQPDVAEADKDGKVTTLHFYEKSCPGSCDGFMILTEGGGDDDSTYFYSVKTVELDAKHGEVRIDAERATFDGSAATSETFTYEDCEFNAKKLKAIRDAL